MRRPKRLPLDTLAPYLLPSDPNVLPSPPLRGTGDEGEGVDAPEDPHPHPLSRKAGRGEQNALLDWSALFGNDRPVELEVGCGKGAFLIAAAAARPDHNFLGLEIDRALQLYIATRIAKRQLTNARVGCADARAFVAARVASASLAAMHVYFPDPWWKKRHQKRRVWTPEFAAQCARALQPGGRLLLATDVAGYYAAIRDLLDAQAGLTRLSASEETGAPRDDEALTNFERKARITGGAVWRAEYERTLGTGAGNLDTSSRASHNK